MKIFLYSFLLLLSLSGPSLAWKEDLALPPAAPLVDEASLLNRGEYHRLENLLRQLKQRSGVEISVFIASGLRGQNVEAFSLAIAEQWKLGKKGEDKALLFLIAPKEREMRLEVGYGMEGDITDAFSRRVLDNVVRPYFQQGRYGEGIIAGIAALQEKIPLGLQEGEAPAPLDSPGLPSPFLIFFLFGLIVSLSLIGRIMGVPTHRGYRRVGRGGWYGGGWGGGTGGGSWGGGLGGGLGGGSWGGGGGGFGGGGASSRW